MSEENTNDIPILPENVIDLLKSDPLQLTKAEAEMVGSISNAKSKKEEIDNDNINPIGLYGDLSEEDYNYAIQEAKKQLIAKDAFNQEKNLEKDLLSVDNQNYCVVSWVGPTFKAKTKTYGFRIMGAFKTLEKAQKYAHNLHLVDSTYDIGVMEMYLWCLGYPDQSDIILKEDGQIDISAMESERDRRLNEFIISHKTKLEQDKQLFEVRKRAIRKSKITKEADENESLIKSVPEGVPTQEMQKLHEKEVEKWVDVKSNEQEDNDDDYDPTSKMLEFNTNSKIPNQEWAVVSFVGYTGNNQRIPICIKGVYASEEEAEKRITQLIHIDDTYDIVPMPLYKWVPCDPDLSNIKTKYKDKQLNDLVEQTEKQKEETLSFHQVRKKYVKIEQTEEIEQVSRSVTEYEYNLKPNKVRFQEKEEEKEEYIEENESGIKSNSFKQGEEDQGEIMSASSMLFEVIKDDSEDIRISAKNYHKYLNEHNDEEPPEEPEPEPEPEIKPMFKDQEEEIRELEIKIQNLMITEGLTENEARNIYRLKFDKREDKIHELDSEDLEPKPKPVIKATNFESMAETIDKLKKEGKTNAEIRKIMSEKSSE